MSQRKPLIANDVSKAEIVEFKNELPGMELDALKGELKYYIGELNDSPTDSPAAKLYFQIASLVREEINTRSPQRKR